MLSHYDIRPLSKFYGSYEEEQSFQCIIKDYLRSFAEHRVWAIMTQDKGFSANHFNLSVNKSIKRLTKGKAMI